MSFKKLYKPSLALIGLLIVCLIIISGLYIKKEKPENHSLDQFNQDLKRLKKEIGRSQTPDDSLLAKTENRIQNIEDYAIKQKIYHDLTELSLEKYDSLLFHKYNHKSLKLAKLLNDSVEIGLSHWNFGAFLLKKQKYADAFYHYQLAQQAFSQNRHPYYEAKMLYNMAFIKGRLKEYTESEALIYKALPYFQSAPKAKQIYKCYTLLSFINEELEGLDQAAHYLKLALNTIEQHQLYHLKASVYNNLGLIYHKKQNYPKALKYFNEALSMEVVNDQPKLLARLLDNRAFTSFVSGENQYFKDFIKALNIRKATNNKAGIVLSQLHLSEILWAQKDSLQAIKLAKDAVATAKDIKLKRELLKGLILQAQLEPHKAKTYIEEWKDVHDEIEHKVRKQRHKVAKIQFQTQVFKSEAERLKSHKSFLIVLLSLGTLISTLIYLYIRQKTKARKIKLKYDQEQLLQLKKEEERNRIAADLHDSILGKLFGLRLQWGLLGIESNMKIKNEHRAHLNTLKGIEVEIRNLAHDLKNQATEINLCKQLKNIGLQKSKIGGFKFKLHISQPNIDKKLSQFAKKQLLAITEEALQNVIKHAQATILSLTVSNPENTIHFEISDNGKGFDKHEYHEGIGLDNIRKRAQDINAQLVIESAKEKGTTIKITLNQITS